MGEPVTNKVPVKPTFSKPFVYFGLLLALLCLVDFLADVLRFVNWRVWGVVAGMTDVALGLIVLPVWLLWLGSQLPGATERFEREERRNAILSGGDEVEMTALKGREVL